MKNAEAVLHKLEELLGPSPELIELIERENVSSRDTPYKILMKILRTDRLEVAKYFSRLPDDVRRTFLFVADLDNSYPIIRTHTNMFYEMLDELPDELRPQTKDELLMVNATLRIWRWPITFLVAHAKMYKSLKEACEQYENYYFKINQLLSRLGIREHKLVELLPKSFRRIHEFLSHIRDRAIEQAVEEYEIKDWPALEIHGEPLRGGRFGRVFFKEITTTKDMVILGREFNNCLSQRIHLALNGTRRYFAMYRSGKIAGFLEIALERKPGQSPEYVWSESEFVNLLNDTIDLPNFRTHMHHFVSNVNQSVRTKRGQKTLKDVLAGTTKAFDVENFLTFEASRVQQLAQQFWTEFQKGKHQDDDRNMGRSMVV